MAFKRVGQVVERENQKTGQKYKEVVLDPEFLSNAKALLEHAYTDKKGGKHLYLFDPREGSKTPSWVLGDIMVKIPE